MLTLKPQPVQSGKRPLNDIPRPLLTQLIQQAENDVQEGRVHTLKEVKNAIRGWI